MASNSESDSVKDITVVEEVDQEAASPDSESSVANQVFLHSHRQY